MRRVSHSLCFSSVPLSLSLLPFPPRSQSHPAHPGHWGEGRTNRLQAGAEEAWRSVGELVAYDSLTFPAVLTNDPTYYWATATAAAASPSRSPPHTNAVPSWQDHHASGTKAVSRSASQPARRAREGRATQVHYQNCPAGSEGRPRRRPPFRSSTPPAPSYREGSEPSFPPSPVPFQNCSFSLNMESRMRCTCMQ